MRDIREKFVIAATVETGTELDSKIMDVSQCRSSAVIAKWDGDADGYLVLLVGVDEESLIPYEAGTDMGGAAGEKMWNLKDDSFSMLKLVTENTGSGTSEVNAWLSGKP
jgi:hypothetical protein